MSANFPPSLHSVSSSPEKKVSSQGLDSAPPQLDARHHRGLAKWINRFGIMLFISVCAVFGVLLVILPWSPKWTDNYILISYPNLRDFVENGFVRGMCTGLGALDLWIGFWDATRYHERHNRP